MSLDPQRVIAQRYRLVRTLGRGAYGEVFEAARVDTNVAVALKVMHERLGEDGVGQRRFEREAEMLRELRHPNIVQLLDYGTTDDELPFIAFELLRGKTLRERLAYGPLPMHEVAQLARQVLSALGAAHAAGIIHRDIKPENVFMCDAPTGMVKLLDFGIAKAEHALGTALTATGQMVGTPHYMAPEQVRALALDGRADIYALGVLIVEACSGQTLVGGESQIEIFMHHLSDEPWALPPALASTVLGRVVEVAVAKRPEDRYPDVGAMVEALDRADLRDEHGPAASVTAYPLRASYPPRTVPPASVPVDPARGASARTWDGRSPPLRLGVAPPGAGVHQAREVAPTSSRRWIVAGMSGAVMLVALGVGAGLWLGRSGLPSRPQRPRRRRKNRDATEAEAPAPATPHPEPPAREVELPPETVRRVIAGRGWSITHEEIEGPRQGFAVATYTINKGEAQTGQVMVILATDEMLDRYRNQPNSQHVHWLVKSNTVIMIGVIGDDPKAFARALAAQVPPRRRGR